MSEIEKQVIKGFNVDKATEDQLNDLSSYELVDIVLFFREQLHRYEQAIEKIKRYCRHNRQAGWVDIEGIFEIIKECEEVNVNN